MRRSSLPLTHFFQHFPFYYFQCSCWPFMSSAAAAASFTFETATCWTHSLCTYTRVGMHVYMQQLPVASCQPTLSLQINLSIYMYVCISACLLVCATDCQDTFQLTTKATGISIASFHCCCYCCTCMPACITAFYFPAFVAPNIRDK